VSDTYQTSFWDKTTILQLRVPELQFMSSFGILAIIIHCIWLARIRSSQKFSYSCFGLRDVNLHRFTSEGIPQGPKYRRLGDRNSRSERRNTPPSNTRSSSRSVRNEPIN